MSDPAIEAARRAWENGPDEVAKLRYTQGEDGVWSPVAMEAAAREALKPIREWFAWWQGSTEPLAQQAWGELAKLIYSTEELA